VPPRRLCFAGCVPSSLRPIYTMCPHMSSTFFKFDQLFFGTPRQPLRRACFRLCDCASSPYSNRCALRPLRLSWAAVALLGAVGGMLRPVPPVVACGSSER
jgi:hypothetical protein